MRGVDAQHQRHKLRAAGDQRAVRTSRRRHVVVMQRIEVAARAWRTRESTPRRSPPPCRTVADADRRSSQQVAADDQPLDVARAFVDLADAHVAVDALDRKVRRRSRSRRAPASRPSTRARPSPRRTAWPSTPRAGTACRRRAASPRASTICRATSISVAMSASRNFTAWCSTIGLPNAARSLRRRSPPRTPRAPCRPPARAMPMRPPSRLDSAIR